MPDRKREFLNSITAMFPIDRSLLPSLSTRRALIVVDPQNDFLAEDGALPIKIPMNLPERLANLATAFRKSGGDVIWVCSRFEKSRSTSDEQILTSDRPSLRISDVSRGRRRQALAQTTEQPCECPEAFLTQESPKLPKCVRPGSSGIDMHPIVQEAVGRGDYSVVKSYYSAFKSEQLLRFLRMRLVTELFICGSTTNISIMATAVDAASHGYTITIVDDCCGYHNIMRHRTALKQISNTTGCDILAAEEVLASLKPKPKPSRRPGDRPATSPGSRHSSVRRTRGEDDSSTSSASDILSSFKNLSLSPGRAADTLNVEASTQDSALPIQPVVNLTEDVRQSVREDVRESLSQSAPAAIAVGEECRRHKPKYVESRNNDQDSHIDAPSPTTGNKEPSLPAIQNRGIVSQHDLETPLDKDSKTNVPSKARLKDDDLTLKDNIKPAGPTSETNKTHTHETHTHESHSKPSDAPPSKSPRLDNNITMAPEKSMKLEESDPLCEGDTVVVYDILPQPLSDNVFEKVRTEARWQRMMHQGGEVPRLAAIQGEVEEDGSMPVYRHPTDEAPPLLPFTPTVLEIKKVVEKQLGHPLNHALIQYYRNGGDFISEHSDKTIDVVKNTFIANVSLGAERTMVFRTKRQQRSKDTADANAQPSRAPRSKRRTEQIALPHNSLCKMGLKTNMKWLHSIHPDKRPECQKSEEQLAYDGSRISLTFRHIATFLDRDSKLIWGQGATGKTREAASRVVNGDPELSMSLLQKFSLENRASDFDWDAAYGQGFDVLHINSAPRLFLTSDPVVNMRVQLMLAAYGVDYAGGSVSPPGSEKKSWKTVAEDRAVPDNLAIKFADNDLPKSIVQGEVNIMNYLARVHGKRAAPSRQELSVAFTRFQQGLSLLVKYRAAADANAFEPDLRVWEEFAAEGHEYIAGPAMTLADYAFWPVLHEVIQKSGWGVFGGEGVFDNLKRYYERIRSTDAAQKVLTMSCARKKAETSCSNAASPSGPSAEPSTSASGPSPTQGET
ncbi:hypothetical protein F4818DRAFT_255295 [Hypoxylon cercidicola]|nr:hypothetical protein F4818DRAFT_255295 [Hypoxylon cercidicola]